MTIADHGRLVLPVSRLAQVVLQSSAADVSVRDLQLMRVLSQIEARLFHLLRVNVLLHRICIVIKELLAASHLLLQSWVDPNLVREHRLVLPMLDAHLLALIIAHLD